MNYYDTKLPWQFEIGPAVIGLIPLTIPRLIIPFAISRAINGLPLFAASALNLDQVLAQLYPWMWLLGLFLGLRAWISARTWLVRQLLLGT